MSVHRLLCLLVAGVTAVTSKCPLLPGTNGSMTVTIEWRYDLWNDKCRANVEGSSAMTSFTRGQKKPIEGVHNDCVLFVCDFRARTLRLASSASSCSYRSRCARNVKYLWNCKEPYRCQTEVYEEAPRFSYSGWQYRLGWFSLFSGYTCGTTGSGPCKADRCFNPFADTKNLTTVHGARCVRVGDRVVSPDLMQYQCRQFKACRSNTFVDLEQIGLVCDNNGTYVTPGTVTWSDACSETVCDVSSGVGKLITRFKGQEGCVHGDRCVGVGDTYDGRSEFTCAQFRCRKDMALDAPYYFDRKDQGCLHDNLCYREGQEVSLDNCKRLLCNKNSSSGDFYWTQYLRGCYDNATGNCVKNNTRHKVGKCVINTCVADNYGRWKTSYRQKGSCAPNGGQCRRNNKEPGCQHKGRCYAVRSVVTIDACLQYVCYSQDKALNQGNATGRQSAPVWQPVPTGCYGPRGCMALGEQYRDPHTLNTYRCDYQLPGLAIKRATFHRACIAPNGQALALGESVLIGTVWYSCYRFGSIRNPIDRAAKFVPVYNHTCGRNPDTGDWLYQAQHYFTPEGRCRQTGHFCEKVCQYFDQPCTQTDLTPYRYIGDKFILDGAECVCTQDYEVNNKRIPSTGSLFNTPSLCGHDKVRGAACTDPGDDSPHQWGELWVRSRGAKICTCHPLRRTAYCSTSLPDVIEVLQNMKI